MMKIGHSPPRRRAAAPPRRRGIRGVTMRQTANLIFCRHDTHIICDLDQSGRGYLPAISVPARRCDINNRQYQNLSKPLDADTAKTNHSKVTIRDSGNLYRYIWRTSWKNQVWICLLSMILAPAMMLPLEVQRRIVNDALVNRDVWQLFILGGIYFLIVCLQGGLKFWLNMLKGTTIEIIARDTRRKIIEVTTTKAKRASDKESAVDSGTVVSILAAETEDLSGFAGDAIGVPLLTGSTIAYVAGYLLWMEPQIAVLAVIIYLPQALIVPLTQRTINRLARLRIVNVRSLGRLAVGSGRKQGKNASDLIGGGVIDRIYRLRIAIYCRKFALAALGNFLDSMGVVIVLIVGGYLVIEGQTQVGTLLVFISGLSKIADPWDELINFYRSVSNTAVSYEMIQAQIDGGSSG